MGNRQQPAAFKSTLRTRSLSAVGMIFLVIGMTSGWRTLQFIATSDKTDVTVVDVAQRQSSRNIMSYSYVFEATSPGATALRHAAKIQIGWKVHIAGDVVAGRASKSSGRVLSNKVLALFKLHAAAFMLYGLFLGRRVIFGPVAYWIGRTIGAMRATFKRRPSSQ